MKKEYFFKFDKVFTVIAFIYIVIMPLFFMERNEIVFLCFSAFFFVEKLVLLNFLKDDASEKQKTFIFIDSDNSDWVFNIWNDSVVWFYLSLLKK